MTPFVKMHGLGNDFVILDGVAQPMPDDLCLLARTICHRRFGVGADGLITLTEHVAGHEMRMWNPDGTDGGMCGNGLRCVARLAHDRHYTGPVSTIFVGSRFTETEVIGAVVRVNMGRYDLSPEALGTGMKIQGMEEQGMETWGISMGNPHWVFFAPADLDAGAWIAKNGPQLEVNPRFANRTNVHVVQQLAANRLKMFTWERGAGLTMACGSGACAVGVAGFLSGRTSNDVHVSVPGGDLQILVEDDGVRMTGAADYSFSGIWPSG